MLARTRSKIPFLLALALGAGTLEAQQPTESVLIGAGDLLLVHIFREPDLDAEVRVNDAGTVTLPLVGTVPVLDLPPAEAAGRIAARYSAEKFLRHPQVSVTLRESASRQIAVLGEVARPGAIPLNSPRSLLDVLALAGGLLKTADRHIAIRHADQSSVTVLVPNDAEGQLAAPRVLVSPGDTLLVPRAGIVYILGDVGRPGGYLMQDDAQLSLLQALSLAAGASKTAAEGAGRLIRRVNGVTTELPLHLKAIEKGKLPDLALQNNDIVYIPFSFAKNLAMGASSVAASASSAIIYAAY